MLATISLSDRNVVREALQLARDQPYIPESPGHVHSSGTVLLCAAACFAAAGLERVFGREARRAFEQEVVFEGTKDVVYRAYSQLGWSAASCTDKLEPNDATPVKDRLKVMAAMSLSPKAPSI